MTFNLDIELTKSETDILSDAFDILDRIASKVEMTDTDFLTLTYADGSSKELGAANIYEAHECLDKLII